MMTTLQDLTKNNLNALIDALIAKFFCTLEKQDKKQSKNLLEKIEKLNLSKNREAMLKQRIFSILVEQIIKDEEISYSELAKKLNERYKLNVPEKGNSMGRVISNVLGSISIIAYINSSLLISLYVINKHTNKPGKGLGELKNILDKEVFGKKTAKVDYKLEKARIQLVFEFLRD